MVPLHPSMVHLPLGLAVIIPLLALGIAIAFRRGLLPKPAWWAVIGAQVLLVIAAVVAMRTGEGEEDVVENVVSHGAIEAHEGAATLFLWSAIAALAISAVVLLVRSDRFARPLAFVATLAALVVTGLGINVGKAGGELVYVHGAAGSYAAAPAGNTAVPAAYGESEGEEEGEEPDDDD